ncbi:MAG: 4Fe-4S binding protein [Acidobacteria bacterium]|nr:4Fe-4S binding protein [Acidobacteriota bacterium]
MEEPTHSIVRDDSRCIKCVACSKACPTKAIRVRRDSMEINSALCTDCGECIRVCRHDAVRAKTSVPADLERFKYTVAVPSMSLFSQFGRDVYPSQVAGALLQHGFDAFYDGSWTCPMVSSALDTYLSECQGPWPKITVTCPAVLRLILIRYPDLAPHLVPLHTPRELTAKLARRQVSARLGLAPADIGVFYITPCSAIIQSIHRPVGVDESYFDGAFSVSELYGPLARAIKAGADLPDQSFNPAGLLWAMAGGETGGMRNANTLSVSGVADVTQVFDYIEAGKIQSVDLIEAYICPDGCLSGPLLVEERYAARRTLQRVLAHVAATTSVEEEKVRALFRQHFFDLEAEIKARGIRPVAANLQQAILRRKEKQRLVDELPHKDCAACGAPDCETLAEDIADGHAELADCVFLKLRELESAPKEKGE